MTLRNTPIDSPSNILNITNLISTTDVILPKYNTLFEPGANQTINEPSFEIKIPKLVQGEGSIILLEMFSINGSPDPMEPSEPNIYAVYDQGSSLEKGLEPFNPLSFFYSVFYLTLIGLVILYFRHRKRIKRFMTEVAKNIMNIRSVLRNDSTNNNIFLNEANVWLQKPEKKRQDIKYIGDYLLIDDFYSEMQRRNSYLQESTIDEAKVIELNTICLEAAERTSKEID